MVQWQVTKTADYWELQSYLRSGWEPFAVTQRDGTYTYFLRRFKKIEETSE